MAHTEKTEGCNRWSIFWLVIGKIRSCSGNSPMTTDISHLYQWHQYYVYVNLLNDGKLLSPSNLHNNCSELYHNVTFSCIPWLWDLTYHDDHHNIILWHQYSRIHNLWMLTYVSRFTLFWVAITIFSDGTCKHLEEPWCGFVYTTTNV